MITKQMNEFMESVKMNKEYNWFKPSMNDDSLPKLPNMENILFISMIEGMSDNPNYILSDGSVCTKEEYEGYIQYMNCDDVFNELVELDKDEDDEDYDEAVDKLEELLWESNPYCEGSILQSEFVSTNDCVEQCKPGHLKFVLREFIVEEGVRLDIPIVVFANDGGDYGSPEVDRIMVDDNCYVKIEGSLDFKLYVFLRQVPEDGKVNIITQLSTCLDD